MKIEPTRQNRALRWFETTKRPGWVIVALIVLLYGRTLPWGFLLDDYRHLRVMADYHEGRRDNIELYRFLTDPEGNRAARTDGAYPWWLGSDVRYQHWRPAAEGLLYLQFTLFGRNPLGYRIVNLLLYVAGALLVLQFLRRITREERLARWGALAFTLLASHCVPVIFISAQGDPLSLVLVLLALFGAMKYLDGGGPAALLLSTAIFIGSLGVKEACLPIAIAPMLFSYFDRQEHGPRRNRLRRATILTGLWSLAGAVWLLHYLKSGYGSNAAIMLSPAEEPLRYLIEGPIRSMVLLAALIVPVNPFLFYLRPQGFVALFAFILVGGLVVARLAMHALRIRPRRPEWAPMVLWVLMFLPLLVCTVPDDRILMLPSVGFAALIGAWIVRPTANGGDSRARWAMVLFLILHPLSVIATTQIFHVIETRGADSLQAAANGFGRELEPGDCAFFLNTTLDSNVLFVQERFEAVTGNRDARVAFLSDVERPVVTRIGPDALEIRASDQQLFDSFIGEMTESRQHPKRVGDVFQTRDFTARITELCENHVAAVEITFQQPLTSDSYRFYLCGELGEPTVWRPPPIESR